MAGIGLSAGSCDVAAGSGNVHEERTQTKHTDEH